MLTNAAWRFRSAGRPGKGLVDALRLGLMQNFPGAILATTTAGGDLESALEAFHRERTLFAGLANLAVGYLVTYADIHASSP